MEVAVINLTIKDRVNMATGSSIATTNSPNVYAKRLAQFLTIQFSEKRRSMSKRIATAVEVNKKIT